jgi:phytoene dehydrogenase-like protein
VPWQRVFILGGGLAGLSCAIALRKAGLHPTILEASDRVGGRVATDVVEGFQLDRGFQVFLDSYPVAKALLDYRALDLKPFTPGALIFDKGTLHRIADPFRQPKHLLTMLRSPIATLGDKWRVWKLLGDVRSESPEQLLTRPQTRTIDRLHKLGFSERFIEQFFKPFYGGVFLERDLATSSRAFDFTFRMFADGRACLPARGMGAIAQQLAEQLPAGSIRLNTHVRAVAGKMVVTESGEHLLADAIVVAVDQHTAASLLPEFVTAPSRWTGSTCHYFAAPRSPINEPTILLNADGSQSSNVNSVTVLSDAAPSYAPSGSLVSVSGLGTTSTVENALPILATMFGSVVSEWKHLRTYTIAHSLPDQTPPAMAEVQKRTRLRAGLYLAGDHLDQVSINGAMSSGLRAAESLLNDQL